LLIEEDANGPVPSYDLDAEERRIIATTRDHAALDAMLEAVMRCENVAALLALARRP
jgi:hypothetical protein